jgi:hypothetical protein
MGAAEQKLPFLRLEEIFDDMPEAHAALEDFSAHVEESVTGAAYDERVVDLMRPTVLSDATISIPDFLYLQKILKEEYALEGNNLVRAIYRCSKNIKAEGLAEV